MASHIARQRGHFGNKIKPIIEPPEAAPASNLFSLFAQSMGISPLMSKHRSLIHEKHIIERTNT